MDFVNIECTSWKRERDRTPLRRSWEPGQQRLVSRGDARILLRAGVWQLVEGKAKQEKVVEAQIEQESLDKKAENDKKEIENVHFEIESMDKEALAEIAQRYGEKLDMRRSERALRDEVSGLIDTYGMM